MYYSFFNYIYVPLSRVLSKNRPPDRMNRQSNACFQFPHLYNEMQFHHENV